MLNKNLLLGLGIGIIFSSIVFYVGFAALNTPNIKNIELSDEQIIERAKKLGMTFETEDTSLQSTEPEPTVEAESTAEATTEESTTEPQTIEAIAETTVKATVKATEATTQQPTKKVIPTKSYIKETTAPPITTEFNTEASTEPISTESISVENLSTEASEPTIESSIAESTTIENSATEISTTEAPSVEPTIQQTTQEQTTIKKKRDGAD